MALPAGRRLGPYEIVAPVGAGGMGEVYRARDVRLDRIVAIKVLSPEVAADDLYRHRFEREARAASALSHPNIAQVYDVGEQDGTHFIAMEYVEGQNLRELVTHGRLEMDRIVDLGLQMASALEEAHGRGVIHRDIKSANVVVTPKGQAKVLDFGLARRTHEPSDAHGIDQSTEIRTQVGVVMGTVPYMSPEQALGKELDARTDLFSLGVVLYELATGRLPFRGDTTTQTIDQICHATPAPLGELREDAPAELERIVGKCLEKHRDCRYTTAHELGVDLRNLLRDRASAERLPAVPARNPRGRAFALRAAAVAVVLLIAAAVAYRAMTRGTSIGSIAVLPFANTTGDPGVEYLSDGISESLIDKLSTLPGLRVISRTSAFAFKGRTVEPQEIGKKLGVDALLVGTLSQRGSNLAITAELVSVDDARHLWGERYSRRVDDVLTVEGEIATTIARTLRGQLNGKEREKLVQRATDDPEAYRLYLKGRDRVVGTGTQQQMDSGIAYFKQAIAKAPDFALAHAGLAEAYTIQAFLRASDRKGAVEKARAAVNRALELDPDLAEAHAALGLIHFYFEWNWAQAEVEFRRAVALNPGSVTVHHEFGNFLTAMGRLDEGLAQSLEAARLDPMSVGPVHDAAINYLFRGELEQAAAKFRRTIEIDPNWTWGYIKLGRTLALQKKCPEAIAQSEIAEQRIASGPAPLSRSWLGTNYALCGENARARRKLQELHVLEKAQYVDPVTFASIHVALGEMEEALGWYEKAFEDRTPNMVFANMGPRMSPELAREARYEEIVRRMGFPQRGGS